MSSPELIPGVEPYYHEDGIALYHGDCRELLPLIPDGVVDLVLTDPPYVHRHVDGGGLVRGSDFYRAGALHGLSDFKLSLYADVLLAAAPMLIAFHSRDLIPDYAALSRTSGRKYDLHVWHKTNAIPFTKNVWKSDLEYLALIWKQKPGWVQMEQHKHSKVWRAPINSGDTLHPTAKPIPLLEKYIGILDAQFVCDPFAGSGTTLVAAKHLNRRAIGIEIEEKYCEIAAKRLAQKVFDFG